MTGPLQYEFPFVVTEENESNTANVTVESNISLPNWFSNPEKLSKVVYEFWMNIMGTDQVDTELPNMHITDVEYDRLTESFRTNVTDPVNRFVNLMQKRHDKEVEALKAHIIELSKAKSQAPTPTAVYSCYACGRNKVHKKNGICEGCK